MTAKQLILCASNPASFSREQLEHFVKNMVTVAFGGVDEVGLPQYDRDFLEFLALHENLIHIAPIKMDTALSTGNGYKWGEIKKSWNKSGPSDPVVYAMDEPFNRALWGCPYDPYTQRGQYIQWKREQVAECQATVNAVYDMWPSSRSLITGDRPVPPNTVPVMHPGGMPGKLIRAYDIRQIEYVAELYGDAWREEFKMQGYLVGGYLPRPIFGLGYSPADIGNLVHALGLDFFLYYWAEDPELWHASKATVNMKRLHSAMVEQ